MTASALATAGGTLVLAGATFASVRSSNRSARATERALLVGMRPLLLPTRPEDPPQPVGFADSYTVDVRGGGATADVTDSAIYLTISVRNAGRGLAVLHGWHLNLSPELRSGHAKIADFRVLSRDLYVAPTDIGFWQGALRDPNAPLFARVRDVIEARQRFVVDLLYGDLEGGQRTVSRFSLTPTDDGGWLSAVARHWSIDMPGPR